MNKLEKALTVSKKHKDMLDGMSLDLKRNLYSFYLSLDNPNRSQVELGFALVLDKDIRAHITLHLMAENKKL